MMARLEQGVESSGSFRRWVVGGRRVTVVTGHFGSGKTEVAVNWALDLGRRGERVTLVDLDVVKPYFRCRALASRLSDRDVRIVAPDGEQPALNLPDLSPDLHDLFASERGSVIVDVGGDPVGALAVGAIADALGDASVEHLLVLNFARPQTETVAQAVAMGRAIEAAARLPLTGLVANTHLLGETTADILRDGVRLADQAAAILGVPVRLVTVEERLVGALPTGWASCRVLPLRRLVFPPLTASPRPTVLGASFTAARHLPADRAVPSAGWSLAAYAPTVRGV